MINIVRVSDKQKDNTYRCYCGRPGKGQLGLLGNPFAANVDHSNRDLVCDQFQKYFELQLEVGSQEFKDKLNELVEIAKIQDIELACFCQSPKDVVKKRCHTETIKAYIEQQLEESKMRYTPESITELKPNEIFVFGSNTQGRHGKGSAKLAMQFGAIYGCPDMLQGNTWAIVTKDLTSQVKYPLQQIHEQIKILMYAAKEQYPELTFLVTKIGCELGGYTVNEIANLFIGLDIPDNVVLPKEFWDVINNQEESKMKTNVNEPIGIIRPVVNQMDCIPSFRNELAFLSNMFECPINNFKCAEAYYQAHKVAGTEAYTAFLGLNGYEAKRLGKQVELRSDWNEVKLSIMEKILRVKFQGELLQKLLAVKGEIVERNNWGDSYWGVCNGKGENHLGKLLMKIRDENVKQQIPSMTYSGIGSRETPHNIQIQMNGIAWDLEQLGFKLYSGAAPGADKAFSDGCTTKIEFIPWKGFNNCFTGIVAVSNEAMELAATLHPAWDKLTQGAKKLMARNCHQILGHDLKSPVDFVLCWTPDGAETKTGYNTGGTGQAIRLANRYGIPVINMFNADWKQRLDVLLKDIHILNQANQISLSTY